MRSQKHCILTVLLLVFCAVTAFAQHGKVSLSLRNATLAQFFKAIEKQTDYQFSYDDYDLNKGNSITITKSDVPVSEVLDLVLPQNGLAYQFISDKSIAVFKNKTEKSQPAKISVVKGIVKDSNGEPVIGAGIIQKGTENGTATDLDGSFVVRVPERSVLVITSVGYRSQEVIPTGPSISITLEEDVLALEETIVIGYGVAKRKDFTGSVASIKLENAPVADMSNNNVLESLRGRITGLDIEGNNTTDSAPSFQLRGQKSISGNNEPLIVVDGTIFMGDIGDISPNDIASVDVLKDATSAAAYGSRSANGVIMITTKKGYTDKPVISFNAAAGIQTYANKTSLRDADGYVDSWGAVSGMTDPSAWMMDQEYKNYLNGVQTNWLDYATRTGVKQDYQVAVSGAAKKLNYYVSASYLDNKGVVKDDDYTRKSVLGKISSDITDWLRLNVDASYTIQDYHGFAADISPAYDMNPSAQATRYGSDKLEKYPTTQGKGKWNPLWKTVDENCLKQDVANNYRLNTSVFLKCPWVEGLTFKTSYAINSTDRYASEFLFENYFVTEGAYDEASRYSTETYQKLLAKAQGDESNTDVRSWVFDNILNYSNTFGKHSLDLTAVATRDYYSTYTSCITGKDFSANGNTSLNVYGLSKASTLSLEQTELTKTNIGYLGRMMYSYDDRYFATASYRRDGSSVFGVDRKWGNFWALGGAWRVSAENIFPQSLKDVLSDLKVKISYGKNGNQGLTPYGTLSKVVNGNSAGNYYEYSTSEVQYGLELSSLGNSELGWESTSAWNFGFESKWFNGRLCLDVDAYSSKTTDQIFQRTIPAMTGFSKIMASLGQIDNWGLEATISSLNVKHGDFTWSTNLTFWLSRNKLVHLYGEDVDGDGKEDDDVASEYFIGKSLGAIFGYVQDGICQEDDTEYISKYSGTPGYPKYKDINGDDLINADDRQILGYSKPNFNLNIANTLTFRDLSLYFMITGIYGGNGYYMASNPDAYIIQTHRALDIPWWTPENKSNVYPTAKFNSDGRFLGLQNRSFARLQDVTLSYNFNTSLLRILKVNSLKAFVSGKNLLTVTKWVGDDPATASSLTVTTPMMRTVTVGASLTF